MNNLIPPDLAVREKINRDLDTNFLVEAGAGSGKTSSLIKRMLGMVMSGKYRVGEIVAVTFTRKAAAELRERFQNKLEEVYRDTELPEVKALLEKALLDLDQCFLGTIHSFCARLLRERPVEAGLDPEFKELDQIQEDLLQQQAWESYLLEVKLERPELLDQLNKIGVNYNDLKQDFIKLNNYTDIKIIYADQPKPELAQALRKLETLVHRAKTALPSVEPDKGWDKLQSAIRKTLRYLSYFDMSRDTSVIRVLANFEKEFSVTQNRWNSKDEAKQYRDEFNALVAEVISPLMQQWREYCHFHILDFLLQAIKKYNQLRLDLGYLNFGDLMLKTAVMLRDYPEVREYFQGKYHSLLIDEFQDTDPIQAEIMFYLTGADSREKDWQQLMPKPGSLFVVGDTKQSIYRFRRADIDTYNLVKQLIEKSGGETLKLTANFRSVQALGEWFNPTFQRLLPAETTPYQAEFSQLFTLRPNEGETAAGVQVLEISEVFTKKDEIVEAEAESIAKIIKHALNGNLRLARTPEEKEAGISEKARPQDFMIILRYKDSMDVYARALEKYGVPVSMAGGSSLAQCFEITEFYKLLRFLVDPSNQVNLVAVLRGLFFGISDDSLYQFKQGGGYFNIFSSLPGELTHEFTHEFTQAFAQLKMFYRWTKQYSPTVAIEKLIIELDLVPFALTMELGNSRSGYIYQVLELLRKAEIAGITSFRHIVDQFGFILDSDIEEELNIAPVEEPAVQLMNLHKAKGLEAPVVFLTHPYKKPEPRVDQHVKRIGLVPEGYFVCTRAKGEFHSEIIGQPPNWKEHGQEELNYLLAEEIRLVYVAATRAKNLLVISRSNKDLEMKKNPWAVLLDEGIQNNLITVPDVQPAEKPDEGEVIKPAQVLTVMGEFGKWVSGLSFPGYSIATPTGLKKEEDQPQIKRLTGGGMAWGTVVHKALEELVKGRNNFGAEDLKMAITIALQENGVDMGRKQEVLEVIEEFKQSNLWSRINDACRVFTEVPFSSEIVKGHFLFDTLKGELEVPVLLSGVIDLVFQEQDGWVIVDYKTDRVVDQDDLNNLIKGYQSQVKLYAHIWQEVTGESVKAGLLHFTNWAGEKTYQVVEENMSEGQKA